MPLTIQDWHNRFTIQAQWTKALRLYFFDLLKISEHKKVLDVGCGTGALLPDLEMLTPAVIYGVDISEPHLHQAQKSCQSCHLSCADVIHLPFPDQSYDIILSHYFLMWIPDSEKALEEMVRISKPGGYIVAFAEPDYEGRLDYPFEFTKIKDFQISSLIKSGANPRMGRQLYSLFNKSGLVDIRCGVYEGNWDSPPSFEYIDSEWQVLESDLSDFLEPGELRELKKHDQKAWKNGSRLIYVPTFYAWGKIPE